jgi:hypothetical protein
VTGLVVQGGGFELLLGDDRIEPRRDLTDSDRVFLDDVSTRYVQAVQARSDPGVLVMLGQALYEWLDGDQSQLSVLLEQADTPVVFEIQGPRAPSDAQWALLRAPFE